MPARSTRLSSIATAAAVLAMGIGSLAGPAPALAAATVDLDQWASSDLAWQNGNLNGNNSRYPEGGIVPFRLAIEGLKAGEHTIHINHDFTAGGHKAYDFLATWNVTNARGTICRSGGGAVSSMCPSLPSASTGAFPSDRFVANGLSVRGAEEYSGAPRLLTIWGGTITSIGTPDHAGSTNGNSTTDFLVRFRSTGSAVLMAWGGHLAQSDYWDTADGGPPDGAAQVSGAPWHMRTLQLDGSGNKNQDRSIQPSAIVGTLPPRALAPTPDPTPRPSSPAAPAPQRTPAPVPAGGGGGGGTPAQAPGGSRPPNLTPPATTTALAARSDPGGDGLAVALGVLLSTWLLSPWLIRVRGYRRQDRRRRPEG